MIMKSLQLLTILKQLILLATECRINHSKDSLDKLCGDAILSNNISSIITMRI